MGLGCVYSVKSLWGCHIFQATGHVGATQLAHFVTQHQDGVVSMCASQDCKASIQMYMLVSLILGYTFLYSRWQWLERVQYAWHVWILQMTWTSLSVQNLELLFFGSVSMTLMAITVRTSSGLHACVHVVVCQAWCDMCEILYVYFSWCWVRGSYTNLCRHMQ